MLTDTILWLGNEYSLFRYLKAQKYALDHPEMEYKMEEALSSSSDSEPESEFESPLLDSMGNVGIMNITGPLVSEDSWINDLFGLVSYPEIARASQELAESSDITTTVMNIDTGGGSVGGLEAASGAIEWLKESMPVTAHTSGSMFSAGYWIGATANQIIATPMAEVGSIGVLLVHTSVHKALEENGQDMTVIRAGKFKALGHPSEELSEDAKAIFQDKADKLHSFFLEHVSSQRSTLNMQAKGIWGEGKTFFGSEGLQIGMVDRVETLSDHVARLADIQEPSSVNITDRANNMKGQKPVILLSEKDKAALESGARLDDVNELETGIEASQASAEGEHSNSDESTADSENDQTDTVVTLEVNGANNIVSFLTNENKELVRQNAVLESSLSTEQNTVATLQADIKGLVGIAEQSLHSMQIALNAEPIDLSGLPASTIVAQHSKVREAFEGKFKIGQQSNSVMPSEDDVSPARRLGIVPKTA